MTTAIVVVAMTNVIVVEEATVGDMTVEEVVMEATNQVGDVMMTRIDLEVDRHSPMTATTTIIAVTTRAPTTSKAPGAVRGRGGTRVHGATRDLGAQTTLTIIGVVMDRVHQTRDTVSGEVKAAGDRTTGVRAATTTTRINSTAAGAMATTTTNSGFNITPIVSFLKSTVPWCQAREE